jgi:hypothetical protein
LFVQFQASHVAPLPSVSGATATTVQRLNKAVHMSLLLKRFKNMYGDDLDKWLPDTAMGKTNLESKGIIMRAEAK